MLPGATIVGKSKDQSSFGAALPDSTTLSVYLSFLGLCSFVWQVFHGVGLSTLPTLSVLLQVLSMTFLRLKITKSRNAGGISVKSLQLQAVVHVLRLSSTLWLKGYVPTDTTGDWLYQAGDIVTLIMCIHILYNVHERYRHSYQADLDSMSVQPIFVACVVMAVMVHPDLNDRFLWDTVWTTSLYIDVVAMVPQLWMLSKIGGAVEGLTGHYVAAVAVSRMANLLFWYHGYAELAPLDGSFNLPGIAVLLACVLQCLLMCDFMYYYVLACFSLRQIHLPASGMTI